MNSLVIDSLSNTLFKSKNLLFYLNDEQLCNKEIAPYYSSVGSHIRHILDFYNCIINGVDDRFVDLTARERDEMIENHCDCAINAVDDILLYLKNLNTVDLSMLLEVKDDLGNGSITLQYTLGALLAQANSHTIHHYAIINYILSQLNITIEDGSFGYNPTTPKKVLSTS